MPLAATHAASSRQKATSALQRPIAKGSASPAARLAAKAQRRRVARSGRLAFFQRASGPIPIKNKAGAMTRTNTISKYGGPTEYLPRFSASIVKGNIVPRKSVPAAAAKKTLFASSIDSRETSLKSPPRPMREVRQAYSTIAPPMKSANSARSEEHTSELQSRVDLV